MKWNLVNWENSSFRNEINYLNLCCKILLIFRKKRKEGESGKEISMFKRNIDQLLLVGPPSWGPGPQLRQVPWLGIEPVAFSLQEYTQSTEQHQWGQLFKSEKEKRGGHNYRLNLVLKDTQNHMQCVEFFWFFK